MLACVIDGGVSISDSTPPSDSASVNRRVDEAHALPAGRRP
jgi:hypothetical protein